ncbi:hypothetical protein CTDIVETGP_1338 [Clostridium tyrobutyricum DIVETGP]|uniref:Uncharacterized protein n=1 Tax=Clostridium tyrobutyricum DIVETGP TaxID=1408889 RepID=W6N434_CLOTY|nr:hypothetical protein CTDIVETGP_1338 [Clostridium tyrobutyricum DIVETGP]
MVRHLSLEQVFVGSNPAWAAKRTHMGSFLFFKIILDKRLSFIIKFEIS